jgi:deoxyhypusine synthase
MSATHDSSAPTGATDAVLKPSAPVPEGAREVQGIDFNQYASRSITVEELVGGYANMGFQATSVGEAVRIINNMVSLVSALCAALALGVCGAENASDNIRALGIEHFSRI